MDANGSNFWLLADETDWSLSGPQPAMFDRERRVLVLPSQRLAPVSEQRSRAELLLDIVPQTVDQFGTFAYYDDSQRRVLATGGAPGTTVLFDVAAGDAVSDLTIGFDGALYIALNSRLRMQDVAQRWTALELVPEASEIANIEPFRLAAQPSGGVLVLDRAQRALWRLRGLPFPNVGAREFAPDVFRPSPENPSAPRLERIGSLSEELDAIALVTNQCGETLLLSWSDEPDSAVVQSISPDGTIGAPHVLVGVSRPFCIGWMKPGSFVVLVATVDGVEAVPYAWSDTASRLLPQGGVYPLARYVDGPLAHVLNEPARYPARAVGAAIFEHPRPLVRLSSLELARHGSARPRSRVRRAQSSTDHPFDGGSPDFVWHRIYLEAVIPEQCGLQVWLACSERPSAPADSEFHLHVFGDAPAPKGTPRGVWSSVPSELPHHPGMLRCGSVPHRAGLFSVLIQRIGRKVSSLSGRYLWIRVELFGNGRSSPELAALRAYGPRVSYAQRYLPRIYHEQLFVPDSDQPSATTTQADFLDRMLLNFEGLLTPLEDRIANAHLLTHPSSAPEEALEWLGQWVGFSFSTAYPPQVRRRALSCAAELHRWRGTLRGLTLWLDIITGDAVSSGEVLVIEDFRLRRTFATILGADLSDEDDPLLAGLVRSGNSFVGDTLILSREFRHEFVAVFRHALPQPPQNFSPDEWVNYLFQHLVGSSLVDDFFEKLANRVTVLVRNETSEDKIRLIERVLDLEAPAHLLRQVVRATYPFIVGLASLVGVDTYLRDPVGTGHARVDESQLGRQSFLKSPQSLDPRLEGSGS